jgi:hypothetical protein
MSETAVSSTYYVSIPQRPHFSELFVFVNNLVLIVIIFLFSLLELELFSVQDCVASMGQAFARTKAAGG